MAFKDLPPEGKEAILNFVRALARWRARKDYADEIAQRGAPPNPANITETETARRRLD